MKNYSELSDFEINKLIAIQLGMKPFCETTGWQGLTSEPYVDVIVRGAGRLGAFNPCNNPSDAWPIIVENNIAVVPYRHTTPQAWPTKFGAISKFGTEDKNPLRAAMIVYLMMKDSENA